VLPLLDVLVCSTTDAVSQDVAGRSRSALSQFSERRLASGDRPLIDALEENVFNLATQLPNQMSVPGDVLGLCCVYQLQHVLVPVSFIAPRALFRGWVIHLSCN